VPLKRFERLHSKQQVKIFGIAPNQSMNHGFDGTSLNLLQVTNEDGWTSQKNIFEVCSQLRRKIRGVNLEMDA
jgi:hypothetical protein